jgi:uncharacterized RDD family membrane protein YckC
VAGFVRHRRANRGDGGIGAIRAARGATLGKIAFGIKAVSGCEERPTLLQAVIQDVPGKVLSSIVFGLGFLMVSFNDQKRGWHDQLAGTHVVHTEDSVVTDAYPERAESAL